MSAPDPDRCWKWASEIISTGNPAYYVDFMRSFYDDPNPRVSESRQIQCPNLVMLGEFDVMFIEPSNLLARCLPKVKHVTLDGLGHMLAIEDPERTTAEILMFLGSI